MADNDTPRTPTLYAQQDGEIAGTHYKAGDPIDRDLHAGTREVLKSNGHIGTTKPSHTIHLPPAGTAIEDMTRAELIASLRTETPYESVEDDDELRDMLTRLREKIADAEAEKADSERADKPLADMTTRQLDAIAKREGVTFGDDKTPAGKIAAIQAKRDEAAKS